MSTTFRIHLARFAVPPMALATFAFAACSDDNKGTAVDARGDASSETGETGGDATGTATNTAPSDATTRPDVETAPNACDPVEQTGCADNQNCTYVANETAATCQTKGVVPPEQACSSEARCQTGVCLNLNSTESLCYQFCAVDADCPGAAAGSCLTLTNASFRICKIEGIYDNCNLLTQDCADAAKSCYAVNSEKDPICLPTGTKAAGVPCDRASDCVEGLACVNDVCRTICDPEAEAPCGANFECNPFFANAGYCEPK